MERNRRKSCLPKRFEGYELDLGDGDAKPSVSRSLTSTSTNKDDVPSVYIQIHLQSPSKIDWSEIPIIPELKTDLEEVTSQSGNTVAAPKVRNRGGRPRGSRGKKFLLQRNSPGTSTSVPNPDTGELELQPDLQAFDGNPEAVPKVRNKRGRPRGSRGKKFLLQRSSEDHEPVGYFPLRGGSRGGGRGQKFVASGSGTEHTPEGPFQDPSYHAEEDQPCSSEGSLQSWPLRGRGRGMMRARRRIFPPQKLTRYVLPSNSPFVTGLLRKKELMIPIISRLLYVHRPFAQDPSQKLQFFIEQLYRSGTNPYEAQQFDDSSFTPKSFSKVEIDTLEMDDIDEEEENDDDDEDDNVGGPVIDEEDEVSRQHMAHVSSIFLEASKAAGSSTTTRQSRNNNNVLNTSKNGFRGIDENDETIFMIMNIEEEHSQRPDFRFQIHEAEISEGETATSITISEAEANFLELTTKKINVDTENEALFQSNLHEGTSGSDQALNQDISDMELSSRLLSILNEALANPVSETNPPEETLGSDQALNHDILDMELSSELLIVLNEASAYPLSKTNRPEESLGSNEASDIDVSDMGLSSELLSILNEALAYPLSETNQPEESLSSNEASDIDISDMELSSEQLSVLNEALNYPIFEANLPVEAQDSSGDDVQQPVRLFDEVEISRPEEAVEDL